MWGGPPGSTRHLWHSPFSRGYRVGPPGGPPHTDAWKYFSGKVELMFFCRFVYWLWIVELACFSCLHECDRNHCFRYFTVLCYNQATAGHPWCSVWYLCCEHYPTLMWVIIWSSDRVRGSKGVSKPAVNDQPTCTLSYCCVFIAAVDGFWNCQVDERPAGGDGSRQRPGGKWDLQYIRPTCVYIYMYFLRPSPRHLCMTIY